MTDRFFTAVEKTTELTTRFATMIFDNSLDLARTSTKNLNDLIDRTSQRQKDFTQLYRESVDQAIDTIFPNRTVPSNSKSEA